ncbi:glycosyl hydrolase [Sedimentisphaera salicampi]|uniref:glycosyl hydrolase n=1 Tax=Sedimentisphaera salicampi TaxID=1941349 RepID=UPI000B9BC95D|nr:glycosyl hydrolase [Sedimentisphaera salicampi]OXU14036.1 Beta-xylosidase [Sedimentisphaera salicampi]
MLDRRDFLISSAAFSACGLSVFAEEQDGKKKIITPKKGIGLATKPGSGWLDKIKQLNVSWHYNWGLKTPEKEPKCIYHVSMIWGKWGVDKAAEYLKGISNSGAAQEVLTFNEPDKKKQANMSVEKAIELWPMLENCGLRLGSPACVHPDTEWMLEFMEQAEKKNLRVDFVTVHDYGGGNAEGFVNKLNEVHKLYGKPLWITEFAVGDWKAKSVQENRHSPAKVLRFMKEVLPELEKLEFLERYAWFPASRKSKHLGTSALFKEDGSLTNLGRFYSRFGVK